MPKLNKSIKERLLEKTFFSPSGCWEWTGHIHDGYGCITINYKNLRCHRVSYTINKGDIPNGMCVCHRCDNRACINPDHLFLGTYQDNMDDKVSKNRQNKPKGQKHPMSILTNEDVLKIRELSGTISQRKIAKLFSVKQPSIYKIVNRITWTHI